MKNKALYIIAILSLLLTASCDSFLDKKSYTDHDEEILNTPEGLNALLNGIYDQITGPYYYGRHMYAYEACKGMDFFVRISSGNNYERECRYAESATSSGYAESSWRSIYGVIRTATDLIEHLETTKIDPEHLGSIHGEAAALRALAYFDLMRLFAYPPRFSFPADPVDDGTASQEEGLSYTGDYGAEYNEAYKWGVPIIRSMEQVNNIFKYEIRRETAVDTYDYIETELLKAQSMLADAEPVPGRINYVAVTAILSRLYLYECRWADVVTQGELALAAAAGKGYACLSYDSYRTNYYQPFNSENIWELKASLTDNNKANSINWLVRCPTYEDPGSERDGQVSQNVGYAAYGLSTVAQTYLNTKFNGVEDVRSYLICDLGIAQHPDYKGCRKYVGEGYHYVHNIPVVRLPEIYLNLAEAHLNLGEVGKAEDYYKVLRAARVKDDTGFVGSDTEECLTELYQERRRELILEGHNYWDYFRRGETMVRPVKLENLNKSNIAFGYGSGKSNARAQVIYPIPLGELEANAAIRDQQNPGYDSYDDVYENQ